MIVFSSVVVIITLLLRLPSDYVQASKKLQMLITQKHELFRKEGRKITHSCNINRIVTNHTRLEAFRAILDPTKPGEAFFVHIFVIKTNLETKNKLGRGKICPVRYVRFPKSAVKYVGPHAARICP